MALNKDWGAKEKGNTLYIVIKLSPVGDICQSVVRISSFDIISGQYRSVKDVIIRNTITWELKLRVELINITS